ncbi:MAG: hypothetical protein LUD50_04805 [Clostridia bacterium]|nr:hypothetical protein [Clostridia bacterium]
MGQVHYDLNHNKRHFLEFNGVNSKQYHLYLSGPGVYNAPAPDVSTTSIPGVNGELIQNNAMAGMRRFSNVDIQYTAFFAEGLPIKTMAVKSWLLSPTSYCRLIDDYDPTFYRMAICTNAVEFEVTRNRVAEMDLTFSCKPQRWLRSGETAQTFTASGEVLRNPFAFPAQPVIHVIGTGTTTLTIGDYSVAINLSLSGGYDIALNCETQNAYYGDDHSVSSVIGEFCNDQIKSDYFPMLMPGDNVIEWTGSKVSKVTIEPRWWTL